MLQQAQRHAGRRPFHFLFPDWDRLELLQGADVQQDDEGVAAARAVIDHLVPPQMTNGRRTDRQDQIDDDPRNHMRHDRQTCILSLSALEDLFLLTCATPPLNS